MGGLYGTVFRDGGNSESHPGLGIRDQHRVGCAVRRSGVCGRDRYPHDQGRSQTSSNRSNRRRSDRRDGIQRHCSSAARCAKIAGANRFLMPGLIDMHVHFQRQPSDSDARTVGCRIIASAMTTWGCCSSRTASPRCGKCMVIRSATNCGSEAGASRIDSKRSSARTQPRLRSETSDPETAYPT